MNTQDLPTLITGPTGEDVSPVDLTLGIEKFKTAAGKHYRLIWVNGSTAWLAKENTIQFQRKRDIVKAGKELVKSVGAKRFNEVTR